jgi:hypothetical protein
MREINQAINTTKKAIKNKVAQHQVEQWEEEEMETTLLKKKPIQSRIQWEMKKMDSLFLTSTKQ